MLGFCVLQHQTYRPIKRCENSHSWYSIHSDPYCGAPLLEECPQHHGHKGDPGVMPGTCGTIGEKAELILV